MASVEAQEKKQHSVRFIPVGSLSGAVWVEKNPGKVVPKHIDPDKEGKVPDDEKEYILVHSDIQALPPKSLSVRGVDGKIKQVPLALNMPSDDIAVRAGQVATYRKALENDRLVAKEFFRLELAGESGLYSAFLGRNKLNRSWNMPRVVLLSDKKDDFPDGAVRLVNVSQEPISYKVGSEEDKEIAPGSMIVLKPGEFDGVLSVYYQEGKRKKYVMRSKVSIQAPARRNIVIANAFTARAKVKVITVNH